MKVVGKYKVCKNLLWVLGKVISSSFMVSISYVLLVF